MTVGQRAPVATTTHLPWTKVLQLDLSLQGQSASGSKLQCDTVLFDITKPLLSGPLDRALSVCVCVVDCGYLMQSIRVQWPENHKPLRCDMVLRWETSEIVRHRHWRFLRFIQLHEKNENNTKYKRKRWPWPHDCHKQMCGEKVVGLKRTPNGCPTHNQTLSHGAWFLIS